MTHTITVTKLPDDTRDDPEYEIGGEHNQDCEAWWECLKASHRHPKNENYDLEEWSTKRVPEEHRFIDGAWMVKSNGCGLRHAFEQRGYEIEMELAAAGLGTHAMRVTFDGDWWDASIAEAAGGVR